MALTRVGFWIIGVCCALFVAVIVTPTGVYEGVWKLATGKDAAAWVQAIGSIAAIVASSAFAIWVPLRMRRIQLEEEHQHSIDEVVAVVAAYGTIFAKLNDSLSRGVAADQQIAHAAECGNVVLQKLELISRYRLSSTEIFRLTMIEEAFRHMRDTATVFVKTPELQALRLAPLEPILADLLTLSRELHANAPDFTVIVGA